MLYKKELIEDNRALKLKVKELENIINKAIGYLERKSRQPEWWDTDFMICIDILQGGDGNLKRILEKENNNG